ncbi:hypothetical protein DUI87_23895 [Hirundo rustica rustica]|uniref:Uncharacterized protein n=1 Tax=Hirundo rustica rustica TaxID=333673 RepID=A0A3M0JFA9_HIRRU|nr:hypothetical protein DUI87_23895 [Hirundo rustica rustica]
MIPDVPRVLAETDVLVSIPDDTSSETANIVNSIGLAACFSQGLEMQDSPASRLPGAIALHLQESLAVMEDLIMSDLNQKVQLSLALGQIFTVMKIGIFCPRFGVQINMIAEKASL